MFKGNVWKCSAAVICFSLTPFSFLVSVFPFFHFSSHSSFPTSGSVLCFFSSYVYADPHSVKGGVCDWQRRYSATPTVSTGPLIGQGLRRDDWPGAEEYSARASPVLQAHKQLLYNRNFNAYVAWLRFLRATLTAVARPCLTKRRALFRAPYSTACDQRPISAASHPQTSQTALRSPTPVLVVTIHPLTSIRVLVSRYSKPLDLNKVPLVISFVFHFLFI